MEKKKKIIMRVILDPLQLLSQSSLLEGEHVGGSHYHGYTEGGDPGEGMVGGEGWGGGGETTDYVGGVYGDEDNRKLY